MAKGRSRSSSSSRHDNAKDKSSSKTTPKSGLFASESSPELLHQIGRAVLTYSMKRLTGQGKSEPSKPKPEPREKSTSRSKDRDRDRDRGRHYRSSSRRSRSRSTSSSSYSRSRRRDRYRYRDRDRHRRSRERDRSKSRTRDTSSHQSRDRGPGTTAIPGRNDSSELHHLLGQVAVGLFGYGIRQYMHHRKLSKQRAAIARPPRRRPGDALTGPHLNRQKGQLKEQRTRGFGGWAFGSGGSRKETQRPSERGADPELAAALKSITADLEGTSRAIRKLAGRSPGHKCEVHERLRDEADGIQKGIERVQNSVNNVRNLHGGLRTSRDMPAAAVPQTEGVYEAAGDGGDKRRMKKERGLQREDSIAGSRSRNRKRGYGYEIPRQDRDVDSERSRGTEGGGYRHSSRLYSNRDRDREERRR